MPTITMAPGLKVWTLTLDNGEVRTVAASSMQSAINGVFNSPVVKAEQGAAIDPSAPAPTVTALEPNTVAIGQPSFTLHVQGTGFLPGAVIVFNGYDEPTTHVSPTEITTGVNMDVWTAPSAPLPVTVRNPNGATAPPLTFTFTPAA